MRTDCPSSSSLLQHTHKQLEKNSLVTHFRSPNRAKMFGKIAILLLLRLLVQSDISTAKPSSVFPRVIKATAAASAAAETYFNSSHVVVPDMKISNAGSCC